MVTMMLKRRLGITNGGTSVGTLDMEMRQMTLMTKIFLPATLLKHLKMKVCLKMKAVCLRLNRGTEALQVPSSDSDSKSSSRRPLGESPDRPNTLEASQDYSYEEEEERGRSRRSRSPTSDSNLESDDEKYAKQKRKSGNTATKTGASKEEAEYSDSESDDDKYVFSAKQKRKAGNTANKTGASEAEAASKKPPKRVAKADKKNNAKTGKGDLEHQKENGGVGRSYEGRLSTIRTHFHRRPASVLAVTNNNFLRVLGGSCSGLVKRDLYFQAAVRPIVDNVSK